MKLLKDILYGVRLQDLSGNTNIAVESVCLDSRKVGNFSLFVALRGSTSDGHDYINLAIQNGAVSIICEKLPENLDSKITYVAVPNSAEALGIIAANFYDNPSSKLKVVGITGTNGKTTTATLLYELFTQMGYKTGLLSTVKNKIAGDTIEATHTTPDSVAINKLMSDMVKKGCTYCFMEVSSIALDQKRVYGIEFDGAVFTNITHDHLDYHETFSNYIAAKKIFFDMLSADSFALVNHDDRNSKIMIQNCKARKFEYTMKSATDFKVRILEKELRGMKLNINGKETWVKLTGVFNAYNVLAVYATAFLLGIDSMNILTTISTLEPVEGRFNTSISSNNITGIVDYAHTPDALQNIIIAVKEVMKPNSKLITVVGCGGDRDKSKRPVMGNIACRMSDKIIFTSDNPRSENPSEIIDQMKTEINKEDQSKLLCIENRTEAIKTAVALASSGDVVLIAGKGHEKYQEILGVKYEFDDKKILEESFNSLKS